MKKRTDDGRDAERLVKHRRKFLGSVAGVAGGLAALPLALGRSFRADPPGAVAIAPCREGITGTTTCTTTISGPGTTGSTTVPTTATGTTSGGVYTTTIHTGTTTVTSPILTGDGSGGFTTGVTTVTQTWRHTDITTAPFSGSASGATLTITATRPSYQKTITVTKSWYYTRPCLVAIAGAHGLEVITAEIAPEVKVPSHLVIGRGPSSGHEVPIIGLGV